MSAKIPLTRQIVVWKNDHNRLLKEGNTFLTHCVVPTFTAAAVIVGGVKLESLQRLAPDSFENKSSAPGTTTRVS